MDQNQVSLNVTTATCEQNKNQTNYKTKQSKGIRMGDHVNDEIEMALEYEFEKMMRNSVGDYAFHNEEFDWFDDDDE